jgi:hypothetical protein
LLEAEGARVVVSSRNHGIRADITKAEDRDRMLDAVPKLYGLVVFAGTPARGEIQEAMRISHQVNYEGPLLLAREAAERMKASATPGAIVLFATMQAVAVFPRGAVAPRPGETAVEVRIEPLDPAAVAPAPQGERYDGNAYRITANYMTSHDAAPLLAPINVVLRYATGAIAILRRSAATWVPLSPTTLPLTFQIYGPTNDLGVFVAVAPPAHGVPASLWAYRIATVLLWLVAAVIAGALIRDYAQRRRRPGSRRPPKAT